MSVFHTQPSELNNIAKIENLYQLATRFIPEDN